MTDLYNILRRPLITEKSNFLNSELHQYAFEVAQDATKTMVKDAVEKIFDVQVVRVNVINVPMKRGRSARSRKPVNRRSAYRKAIVTLAAGNTIPVFEGVK